MTEKVNDYRDLLVWRKSIALVKHVYDLLARFPKHVTYALSDQMRRSAVSVPSNIAEGQGRQHAGEFRQFLHIALGSISELHTQLVIAKELGYISEHQLEIVFELIVEIRKMLRGLIASLK